MILSDGTEITKDADGSVKYGRDGMAELLHVLSMNMGADCSFGDVDSPVGWVDQFGKRLLRGDSNGFVWVEKYANEAEATEAGEALELVWLDWLNDATCQDCGTDFSSDEGFCWCCGARNAVVRIR